MNGLPVIFMDLDRHDFQLEELIDRIKGHDHRLIALQIPEGLKMQALEMMDEIEDETSAKVILAADPCYLSLIHISEPTDRQKSRMPSSA